MKQFIGKNRAENLEWLVKVWLNNGPPVCFLQGFAGVGKTDIARDFRELAEKAGRKPSVINEVADRATPDVLESLMELSMVLSQQGLPEMEHVLFEERAPNLAYALEKALKRPVVMVLDEAQRFFRVESGAPLPEMKGILAYLRNRQDLPGRLLLLSDRIVEDARWSEWIPKRTVTKLEPDEAIIALNAKLEEAGVEADISDERKHEVVRDLDYNPRGIEALVGALRYDSLDEIIESKPGLWAVRDRGISRDFLKALERDLLERTLRHLDEAVQRKLWFLAVHRRSFKREALERLTANKDESSELRSILVTRFLLRQYKGALSLNPIVREVSLSHLRQEPAEFKQAHSVAADYHKRHFEAKGIVGAQARLGASFAELRYHLVQANREDELALIGQRFTAHLKQEIKSVSPVPKDREELDERIAVLTVLLGSGGAKGLEYHLARCLQRRGGRGDVDKAISHARRAIDRGIAPSWVLLADLLGKAGKTEEAVALLKEGIQVIPPEKNLFSLYQMCADLLAKAGKTEEAVALLKEGIQVIPPEQNLFSLYQICADLLAKAGNTEEAVALLKEGIQVIPPDKSLFSLYQICADLLARAGNTEEGVALLKEGIQVIPPDKNLFSLYQTLSEVHCRRGRIDEAIACQREGLSRIPTQYGGYKLAEGALYLCVASGSQGTLDEILAGTGSHALGPQQAVLGRVLRFQMQGDWHRAATMAGAARAQFPPYFALAAEEAFSYLAAGDPDAAWSALTSFPNLVLGTGAPHVWVAVFIHLRRGRRDEASTALSTYLGRPADESRELNEGFLLRLWDQQEVSTGSSRLCFHFPLLPPSITGQSQAVRRVPFGQPVLPTSPSRAPASAAPASHPPAATPDIYVSYAWGEDVTEAGRKREEIVDRLCEAVLRTGREIGRDKDRMRGGDSIERFAHEISRAKRIVAVISEESLHSEFCMAHELFRAFRRCDYQRAEFQEKVIAVVMDDARPLLKDNLALVALAKSWQERMEKLRAELQAVDPTRKSPGLWVFVDMMEEMCPRLPDMLGALKDIIMKRGFDEIVADGFREVISRLPE
jgi:tetratricopeptide (TPR) repeat protein